MAKLSYADLLREFARWLDSEKFTEWLESDGFKEWLEKNKFIDSISDPGHATQEQGLYRLVDYVYLSVYTKFTTPFYPGRAKSSVNRDLGQGSRAAVLDHLTACHYLACALAGKDADGRTNYPSYQTIIAKLVEIMNESRPEEDKIEYDYEQTVSCLPVKSGKNYFQLFDDNTLDFYAEQKDDAALAGKTNEIPVLSELFHAAVGLSVSLDGIGEDEGLKRFNGACDRFCEAYDAVCRSKGGFGNVLRDSNDMPFLSCALFWVDPYFFVPLDLYVPRCLSRADSALLPRPQDGNSLSPEGILMRKLATMKPELDGREYLGLCLACREALASGRYNCRTVPEVLELARKEEAIKASEEAPATAETGKEKAAGRKPRPCARNLIIFGAPGTGKSYRLKEDAEKHFDPENVERVTFHPDYTHAQFFGTYKPIAEKTAAGESVISYDFVPGPFLRAYVRALKNPDIPCLLIIEEINRADAAGVFGDAFQLLDRSGSGASEYPILVSEDAKRFLAEALGKEESDPACRAMSLPENLYLWATMNSADQGVFPMDTAFKRRWEFEYIGVNAGEEKIRSCPVPLPGGSDEKRVEWNDLRRKINDLLIRNKVNEDKLLGPFFLSGAELGQSDDSATADSKGTAFAKAFKNKVLMYLFEDAAKPCRNKVFAVKETTLSGVFEKFDKEGAGVFEGMSNNDLSPAGAAGGRG